MSLKNRIVMVALGVVLASMAGRSALAELQPKNDSTFGADAIVYDTVSGLSWLKLPLSGTKSYNDMIGADGSNEFAPGGAFAGFRYATLEEVKQLWINAGIPESAFFYGFDEQGHNIGTYQTNDSAVVTAVRNLQTMIGYTLTQARPPHMNAGGWRTQGLTQAPEGIGFPKLGSCTVGTGFCGGSSAPLIRAHVDVQTSASLKDIRGYHHWLVRDAAPQPKLRRPDIPVRKPDIRIQKPQFSIDPRHEP
ncbi:MULTISPECIES: hypothetical protein [unclassified Guyparkeria]|uniref:hypothetical protein n=1 Tax=unclassified Guyparkeria TaxID=2626246 RepID=UPI000B0BE044|nr:MULTISPECIES: hypothetical protein [unclassified Guyparkeria]